jgi:hypothetical protein
MPDVRDSSPRILYWHLDEDIETLAFQNVTQDSQIEFQTKPLAGGETELVLSQELGRGLHCVVQNASSLPGADIPHWCSSLGGVIDVFLESKSATKQMVSSSVSIASCGSRSARCTTERTWHPWKTLLAKISALTSLKISTMNTVKCTRSAPYAG